MDGGSRKPLLQTLHKTPEDIFLNLSSSVFGLAGPVKSTDIADSYGMSVMAGAVGSGHLKRTALLDGSVKTDHVVVAYHLEASLPVPAVYVGDGEVLALGGGGTVDYYFID